MELNKNKIIFAVVGAILTISFIFLLVMMWKGPSSDVDKSPENNIKIWMVGDNFEAYNFVTKFKDVNTAYKNKNIDIQVFPSYEDYTIALSSAISSGTTPDIFMLNNNEKNSVFLGQVVGVSRDKVNPNDFRKIFKTFFSEDLIESYTQNGNTYEHVRGIPVGYELLGVFYNRTYVRSTDLSSLSSLSNKIAELKEKNNAITPISIGNGTTVFDSPDIFTQFLMLAGATSFKDLSGNALKEALSTYLTYGDVTGYNGYNARYNDLKAKNEKNVYLFVQGETYMIVGYPSLINRIKEKGGFSKNFLEVAPFPHYMQGGGKSLANYNYFVINKNTSNKDFANDFMAYLASDNGASTLLSYIPFQLPALISLEESKLGSKIDPNYNMTLGDFYNENYQIGSFDKGIKNIYDRNLPELLDKLSQNETEYKALGESILCKLNKALYFTNLSENCDK